MCLKLLLYNLVDDQHLEKHVLFQPWVKSKRSVCVLQYNTNVLIPLGAISLVSTCTECMRAPAAGVSVQLVTVLTGGHQPNASLVVVATAAVWNREKIHSCPCECLFDLFSIKCQKHTHPIRIWSPIGGNMSRKTILSQINWKTCVFLIITTGFELIPFWVGNISSWVSIPLCRWARDLISCSTKNYN